MQRFPQLKQCVKASVEKAVQDLLALVVERSIKVALTTTEHIIKKVRGIVCAVHVHDNSYLFCRISVWIQTCTECTWRPNTWYGT